MLVKGKRQEIGEAAEREEEMTFSSGPSQRRHDEAVKIWLKRRPRIIELLSQGKTQTEISKDLGVSQNAVSRWMRKMGIKR